MDQYAIAVDAMGGDLGAKIVVPAAIAAVRAHPQLHLILVGNGDIIRAELQQHRANEHSRLTIHPTSQVVAMDEKPALALRHKKDSSMRVAINLVKEGVAHACVSAGNTGALMATAHFVLKTLPGIERAAILGLIPTFRQNKMVRMLDLGASVDATPEQLLQFAAMGSVVSQAVDGIQAPRVGLLNVGAEQMKGNALVQRAAELFMQHPAIHYIGYVEGDGIYSGDVDVIVCDGFAGNIALKSIEGLAKIIGQNIKEGFNRNWFTKLAGLCSLPVLNQIKKRMDPSRYNGASFVGLSGTVIKSHGHTTVAGFQRAIEEAIHQVEQNVPDHIRHLIDNILTKKE